MKFKFWDLRLSKKNLVSNLPYRTVIIGILAICDVDKCRVIAKSLCTCWLHVQYRKLQVMPKVSPDSHRIFIDTQGGH
jgi:hypothetical protein